MDNSVTAQTIVIMVGNLVLMSLLTFTSSLQAENRQTVTLGTGEWSPYTTQIPDEISGQNEHAYGIVTEIISEVLREMNVSPVYQFASWDKTHKDLYSGAIMFGFPYVETDKRKEKFIFSDPLLKTSSAFFFNIHSVGTVPSINGAEDVKGYRMALLKGYEYPPLKEAIKGNSLISEYDSEIAAFQALINGQVDILPLDIKVGDHILSKYFVNDNYKIDRITAALFGSQQLKLMANRANQPEIDFIDAFNRSLSTIRANGMIDVIRAKYGLFADELSIVRLVGTSDYPIVNGTVGVDDSKGYLIPNGTKAAVKQWHEYFRNEGPLKSKTEMIEAKTQVLILEGPKRGVELWVPTVFLSHK